MDHTHWKLREYLDAHKLTALTVEQEAGLGQHSIYRLLKAGGPALVNRKTLSGLISALRTLTGLPVSVADLLEYQEPPQPMPMLPVDGATLLANQLDQLEANWPERDAWLQGMAENAEPFSYDASHEGGWKA
jgi:hypothetical protein